jgi:hypothetical protein
MAMNPARHHHQQKRQRRWHRTHGDILPRPRRSNSWTARVRGKVNAERDVKRKQLAEQLKVAMKSRDKDLAPVTLAREAAEKAMREAHMRAVLAEAAYNAATAEWHGLNSGVNAKEYPLRQQLGEIAPACLCDAHDRLFVVAHELRQSVRVDTLSNTNMLGDAVRKYVSNVDAINAAVAEIKIKSQAVEAMIYSDLPQSAIEEKCAVMLKEGKALAAPILPAHLPQCGFWPSSRLLVFR